MGPLHLRAHPRVSPLAGADDLERTIRAGLRGTPTLVTITGRDDADVAAATDHLACRVSMDDPTVRVVQATGLAWERDRAGGVLERLGWFATDPETLVTCLRCDEPLAVLILEAQDADPRSLQLLSSAIHRMPDGRVVVIAAATVDDLDADPTWSGIVRAHRRSGFFVDALSVDDIRDLAASMGVTLDPYAARRLWRHTEGSASQAAELLTCCDPSTWSAVDDRMPATPSAIAAVERALAGLDEESCALVESCAVIGRWCDLAELAAVSRLPDVASALDRASASGLLTVRPGLHVRVGFPTRMTRAAVYEAMGVLRRQELHARAAEALGRPGEALYHAALAGRGGQDAVAADLELHAEGCAAAGSWRDAGLSWLTARRIAPDAPTADADLISAVDALLSAGDVIEAGSLAPELEKVAPSPDRLRVQGYQQILLGHRHEAEDMLARSWEGTHDPATLATIAHRRALHALSDGDAPGLVRWCNEAMARADAAPTAALEASTMRGLGLGGMGHPTEALADYERLGSEHLGGAQQQRALMGRGWLHLALDQVPLAAQELALAAPIERGQGSTRVSVWASTWLARARLSLGDLAGAQTAVDRAVAVMAWSGQRMAAPLVHWSGAELAALRGDAALADAHVAAACGVRTDYATMRFGACMAQASVALTRGDYASVVRALRPLADGGAEGLDEPGFWPWQDTYALALVAVGEIAEADAFLRPHEALAAERGHRSSIARLGAVRARIMMVSGDVDAARAAYDDALAQVASEPTALLRARLRFGFGQALRRAGKRREAETQLRTARQGFAAIGASAYLDRCDNELKVGVRQRDPSSIALTPAEQAVVDLVVTGMSNAEVAASLFISVKTVQYHLTQVYRRLGVRSRAELTALVRGGPGTP